MDTDGPGRRSVALVSTATLALAAVPAASAHGGAHVGVPQSVALVPLLAGLAIVAASVYLHRTVWSARPARALATTYLGLVFAVVGTVALVQLSAVDVPPIQYSPARSLYGPVALLAGGAVVLGSLVVGRLRWPSRPRYAALGVTLGVWVAYPALPTGAGMGPLAHPVGYLVVATVPALVGYLLWRDCRDWLRTVLADPVAAAFGFGVGVLGAVFFAFSTGTLTVVPDDGVGLPTTHALTAVVPVEGPLVYWPAFEFWYPSVPLGGYVSPGMVVLVGLLSALVGLSAAVVAYRWRCRSGADASEGIAGTAALAAPNACCCCGPALAQVAVVALGPTAAAPLYWLFVDVASPVGALFFAAAVALLTRNLVRSASVAPPRRSSGSGPGSGREVSAR